MYWAEQKVIRTAPQKQTISKVPGTGWPRALPIMSHPVSTMAAISAMPEIVSKYITEQRGYGHQSTFWHIFFSYLWLASRSLSDSLPDNTIFHYGSNDSRGHSAIVVSIISNRVWPIPCRTSPVPPREILCLISPLYSHRGSGRL